MSTRCQIGFYEKGEKDLNKFQALLYRHSDGYPEGVLPDIEPFLKDFQARRGLDIEYASAWLMHELIEKHITVIKDIQNRHNSDALPKDGKDYLGHGVSNAFHGDIEYFYAIDSNSVKVYSVDDTDDVTTWKLIKVVMISKPKQKVLA